MLVSPPHYLVRSDYRSDQLSRERTWLDHPALRKVRAPQIPTDGRRWICMGPTLLPEVLRLRRVVSSLHPVIPAKAGHASPAKLIQPPSSATGEEADFPLRRE
jgi:hypothetical protein